MSTDPKYEPVIGLEVHVQLSTETKAFSRDPNMSGKEPNTNVSVVSLGHPGSLPRMNESVIKNAIKLGLATQSKIADCVTFSRKNYFYTDLPKGYQITQQECPICTGGRIPIQSNGKIKFIHLIRIHIEEDAGKSVHDQDPENTLVDLNRAGIPLVEIVSEPEISHSSEAVLYLTQIRRLVRHLGISDGNMEEGSLRCDANVSVKRSGDKKPGTRLEIKNLNSFSHLRKAIDFEIARQIEKIENGDKIAQQTLSYDEKKNITFPLREKEEADDYRYFPDPDLNPYILTHELIEEIQQTLPALPWQLSKKYESLPGLSQYDADILSDDHQIARYFEALIEKTENYKSAANWVMGPIKSWLNENNFEMNRFPVSADNIAGLIGLIDSGKVSHSLAVQKIFPRMIEYPAAAPEQIIEENNLLQESNRDEIMKLIYRSLKKYPEKVKEYQQGKKGLTGLFMGEIMKKSGGKADPKLTYQLLIEELNKK